MEKCLSIYRPPTIHHCVGLLASWFVLTIVYASCFFRSTTIFASNMVKAKMGSGWNQVKDSLIQFHPRQRKFDPISSKAKKESLIQFHPSQRKLDPISSKAKKESLIQFHPSQRKLDPISSKAKKAWSTFIQVKESLIQFHPRQKKVWSNFIQVKESLESLIQFHPRQRKFDPISSKSKKVWSNFKPTMC